MYSALICPFYLPVLWMDIVLPSSYPPPFFTFFCGFPKLNTQCPQSPPILRPRPRQGICKALRTRPLLSPVSALGQRVFLALTRGASTFVRPLFRKFFSSKGPTQRVFYPPSTVLETEQIALFTFTFTPPLFPFFFSSRL